MPRAACIRNRGACGARPPTSTRSARRRAPTSGNACKRWGIGRIIRRPSSRGLMRLHWNDLGTPRAEKADGETVELSGFPLTVLPTSSADHFLMMAEPGCCQGCVPANRLAVVEIFADQPLKLGASKLRLTGTWQVSPDPDGWRYQLRGAEVKPGVTRRALMAASPLFCLPVPAMAQVDGTAVDIHSHAGNLVRASIGRDAMTDV